MGPSGPDGDIVVSACQGSSEDLRVIPDSVWLIVWRIAWTYNSNSHFHFPQLTSSSSECNSLGAEKPIISIFKPSPPHFKQVTPVPYPIRERRGKTLLQSAVSSLTKQETDRVHRSKSAMPFRFAKVSSLPHGLFRFAPPNPRSEKLGTSTTSPRMKEEGPLRNGLRPECGAGWFYTCRILSLFVFVTGR
jgi:hypothetical protein